MLSFRFKSLMSQGDTWNLNRVEALFLEAIPNLPVEQACLSYISLEKIMVDQLDVKDEKCPDPVYVDFIKVLHKTVEARLVQRVGMATKCSAWGSLPLVKQKSIMQMGFFDPIEVNPKSTVKVNARTNLRRNQSLNSSSSTGDVTSGSRTTGMLFRREPTRQTIHGRTALRSPQAPRNSNNSQSVGRQSAPLPRSGIIPLQPNRSVLTARSQSAHISNAARTIPLNNRPIRNRSDCSTPLSANLTNSRTSTT